MSLAPQLSINVADTFIKRVRDFCRAQQITVHEGSAYLADKEQVSIPRRTQKIQAEERTSLTYDCNLYGSPFHPAIDQNCQRFTCR